jgi:MoxR-like ATPase
MPARAAAEHKILLTQPGRRALDELEPVMTAADIVVLQDEVPKVKLDGAIVDYILDLVDSTRHDEQLHLGVSPRGTLALTQAVQASALLEGRDYVTPDDVKGLFIPVCSHRVVSKTYLHNGDANATARVLESILGQVAAPR